MSDHNSSESPEAQDQNDEDLNEQPTKRQKRSRACQACRGMKIRCLPVEGQEACKACSKVNRTCIMPGPARKRQKTVHKVAELEKKIDALTASLVAKNNAVTAPTPPNDSPLTVSTPSTRNTGPRPDKVYSWDSVVDKSFPPLTSEPKAQVVDIERDSSSVEYEDAIARGLIGDEEATRIFNYWKIEMCPYFPVVAFPDRVDVHWLRHKRPMTLLSIFVAATGVIKPIIQPELSVEMARQLADRVMFYNEKSMDLIHAMSIYSTWHGKHKYAKDLGFNHYINSSIAMCLDLGLGKRSRQKSNSDPEDAEQRRTWMACYWMASNVATVLRLPPLLKFSPYLEECLEVMAAHAHAVPSDKMLCCMVRLTHIKEDVSLLFHMDDPGSSIPLNDSRTQYHLKMFERQLAEWVTMTRPYLPKPIMDQYEATISLYIHEIAIHNEHNIDDFRPMYRATGRETGDTNKDFLTNAHFEALAICVDSMINAIHAYLSIENNMLRSASAMHTVWTAYVTVAMIRLHGVLALPGSKYGSMFLPKLNVIGYLDAIIAKLTAVNTGANASAEAFVVAFMKLKAWHVHRTLQQKQAENQKSDQPESFDNNSGRVYNPNAPTGPPVARKGSDLQNIDGTNTSRRGSTTSHQQQQPYQQPPYPSPVFSQYFPLPYQQQQQQLMVPASSSKLLDPNAAIDASTFDVQNWDLNVGELDNFETYLNDAGWMGYLM